MLAVPRAWQKWAMRRLAQLLVMSLTLSPAVAHATGMQGHVYMAMCAAEQLPPGRLKGLLSQHERRLINGGFFPDSGYTSKTDHDQGEIPHWESYVEGWVEEVRSRYPSPWTDPEGQKHVAFLMGFAAHGITDSTFDTMLFARSEQIDPGGPDELDMSMDVFLVADLSRQLVPELDHDSAFASDVFGKRVSHPVAPAAIDKAMSTARSGMGAVVKVLAPGVADFAPKYPWARKAILDPHAPGGYPFGARVVKRYWEELEKRLDGDHSADGVVIGTYPAPDFPLVTLDHTRVDARVAVFFGHGLDRASVADDSVVVLGPGDVVVPAKLDRFRGDQWLNAIVVAPVADWLPDTDYTLVVKSSIRTLHGASPSQETRVTFSTRCATTPSAAGCPASAPSKSPCPLNDARFQPVAEVEEGAAGAAGSAGAPGSAGTAGGSPSTSVAPSSADDGGGCAFAPPEGAVGASLLGLASLLWARRRSRARG